MKRGHSTTYAKSVQRKSEITEAALAIIDEDGHPGFTIAAAAERVGMPVPSVIYHFPTRSHLLVAVAERIDAVTAASLGALHRDEDPAAVDPADIAAQLVALGKAVPHRLRLRRYISGEAVDPDHPGHEYIRRLTSSTIASWANVLRRRRDAGLAHPDLDVDLVGRQMVAAFDGLELQWLVDPNFDLEEAVRNTVRQLTKQEAFEARQALSAAIQTM